MNVHKNHLANFKTLYEQGLRWEWDEMYLTKNRKKRKKDLLTKEEMEGKEFKPITIHMGAM